MGIRMGGMIGLGLWAMMVGIVSAAAPSPAAGTVGGSVQPFVDRHELADAVMLVADRKRVLTAEAVGWADIAAKSPMRTDSMFWIASQSKSMTAAALMMLVDEGKVKLTDPVEKYLPEFRGIMYVAERGADHVLLRKPKQPITIRNVLSHTSGLPFASPLERPTLDRLSLADRVRSYAMGPLDFAPDSQYRYSNAGINTAGRIIEVVARMSFESFLDKRLFEPLGMKDTTFWPDAKQALRIAKSYRAGEGGRGLVETTIGQLHYPLTDRSRRSAMPAGGLFSTARDVARYYQMLLNGGQFAGRRVLSAAAVKEMTRRQTPANVKASYGLGLSVGGDGFGHGGAYSTNTTADTRRGLISVWLVQHASFPGRGGKSQGAFKAAALKAFPSAAQTVPPARSDSGAKPPVRPAPPALSRVCMYPPNQDNGRCFRELFQYPDEWARTRRGIDAIGYADHVLNRQFSDAELRPWLAMLDKWGVRLELEVGAVKPWGPTGEKTFRTQSPIWDRVRRLGGRIHTIAMDEPLCCVRKDLHKPDAYAVEETARFIALVRKHDPNVLIGDIEPYPFIPLKDLTGWIEALEARLARMGVRGLDFFRLDVNWMVFTVRNEGSWREVRKLETFCRKRKLPFSLIYWAADYPDMKRRGLADDATWYVSLQRQAYDYTAVDGKPDQYVIESWIGAPSHSVPETAQFTLTRSVLDFTRRFATPPTKDLNAGDERKGVCSHEYDTRTDDRDTILMNCNCGMSTVDDE